MTTLRELRHQAQDAIQEARVFADPSKAVVAKVREVMDGASNASNASNDLRESLDELWFSLKGRQGFSKEEQVHRLAEAEAMAEELRAQFMTGVEEYRAQVKAGLEAALAEVEKVAQDAQPFDKIESALAEAKALAETRDFEEHQKSKHQYPSYSEFPDELDEDEDEDEDEEEYEEDDY